MIINYLIYPAYKIKDKFLYIGLRKVNRTGWHTIKNI